tara:strand:+ start:355 stop:606 length:252 start_codon:yes stop_codon:yes gene_type:complete
MIHIDNLDGEGTIFMSTDDGTQSIGHVEKEYASILQDVLESYDWYVEEFKRLREDIKQLIVKVEGMSTGYRKPIVKALKEMIE